MCTTATHIHKFEQAGLGKAPFAYQGCEERWYVTPGHKQPGSTCDFCGNGIAYCFWLKSADGRKFKVGSECIQKAGDSGLMRIVKDEERKRLRDKRHAAEQARIVKLEARYAELRPIANSLPHPCQWRADQGEKLSGYVEWYKQHAGVSGYTTTLKHAIHLCEKA